MYTARSPAPSTLPRVTTDLRADASVRLPVRRPWLVPASLFVGCAAVYALTATLPEMSLDLWSSYFLSWQLASGGGPWIDGVFVPRVTGHELEHVWILQAPNGHLTIGRSPGTVLAGLPAYWLFGAEVATSAPGAVTAALLTAGTVTLFHLTLRGYVGTRWALGASLVLGFTTPVWSVAANGIWPHTITILGIAGMAWAVRREQWWLVGVLGGIVVWGRVHAAVIVAVVGLGLAWHRRDPRIAVVVGTISGSFLGLLCVWDRWMYGSWSPTASYEVGLFFDYAERNRLDLGNHIGFWLSPEKGILVWTPVIVVLLPALVRSWRSLPDWARWLLIGGLLYTLLQGTLNRYSGGHSFHGYRLGLEFLVCAAPALTLAARSAGVWAHRVLLPLVVFQLGLILWGSGVVERLS